MQTIEKTALTDHLVIDPKTGEILSCLKWDAVLRRYSPAPIEALSRWELHLVEGSARLRKWAIESAIKKGYF